MNKTKIEWCDSSVNPITGCIKGCEGCYARSIANRFSEKRTDWGLYDGVKQDGMKPFPWGFAPTFHPDRLTQITSLGHTFVCSMSDMFGNGIPHGWTHDVMDALYKKGGYGAKFTILTKEPGNAEAFLRRYNPPYQYTGGSPKINIGTSWDGELNPRSIHRLEQFQSLSAFWRGKDTRDEWYHRYHLTCLSLEPMLHEVSVETMNKYFTDWIDWLIIGGLTGSKKHVPFQEEVEPLVEWARGWDIPVFVKGNAAYEGAPQEWPKGIK